jgi:hypothetical protein
MGYKLMMGIRIRIIKMYEPRENKCRSRLIGMTLVYELHEGGGVKESFL